MKNKPLSFAIALALLASAPLHADNGDAEARDTAANKSDDTTSLESITVTARRREETLQDVPVAVTALSAATLEVQNVQSLNDLAGNVPNLVIHDARGSNTTVTAYIRGVGQSDPT